MLQAFIDDSGKGHPDLFVLAGYVSTAEKWAKFSDEWQRLLDMKSPHYRHLDYFKMAEMDSARDRERCAWFHKVIEDHAMAAISFTISTKELRRYVRRIFPDPKLQEALSNPWHYAMTSFMWGYAQNRKNLDLPLEPIEFIFDNATEKNKLLAAWDGYKEMNPEQAPLMGPTPGFKDDREYLPLQAADIFAWWVRHWQIRGMRGLDIYHCQFDWPRTSSMPWTHIMCDKQHIRERLRDMRPLFVSRHARSFIPRNCGDLMSN